MSGFFYKLGVDLALRDSGLQKLALGLGELAQAVAKSAIMQEAREDFGMVPPSWKPTLPVSTAVGKVKDFVEILKEKMKPEVVEAPEAPPTPGLEN